MVDELTRQEIATWFKDGKSTPHGRRMAKFLDRVPPVREAGQSLTGAAIRVGDTYGTGPEFVRSDFKFVRLRAYALPQWLRQSPA